MLYELSEKLKRRIYGRLERTLFGERKTNQQVQESINRGTEEFESSVVPKRNETKIPDPWFN